MLQAGNEAKRVAEDTAAAGHTRLLALQQKQEGVLADMHLAQRDRDRQRTLWEQDTQQLQRERDELFQNIQVRLAHIVLLHRTLTFQNVHSLFCSIMYASCENIKPKQLCNVRQC